jgi:hypothetical protein
VDGARRRGGLLGVRGSRGGRSSGITADCEGFFEVEVLER